MKCAICAGKSRMGKTTVSVDTGTGVIVIRDVPAFICVQCGEEWLTDRSAHKVEDIISRAKREKTQIEVVAMA